MQRTPRRSPRLAHDSMSTTINDAMNTAISDTGMNSATNDALVNVAKPTVSTQKCSVSEPQAIDSVSGAPEGANTSSVGQTVDVATLLMRIAALEQSLKDTQAQLCNARTSGDLAGTTVSRGDSAVTYASSVATQSQLALPQSTQTNSVQMQSFTTQLTQAQPVQSTLRTEPPSSVTMQPLNSATLYSSTIQSSPINGLSSAYNAANTLSLPSMSPPQLLNNINSNEQCSAQMLVPSTNVQCSAQMMVPRKLIDLPGFSGLPEDWPLFFNAFRESTAVYRYSNLENNQRLLKCLKGEAREVVKSPLIHPDNVNAVIDQLKFRFGRPEVLIRSQLRQVREIAHISENAIEKLIPFATAVKNLSTFLQAVNGQNHLANPTLLEELVSKLPTSKKLEWARYAATITPYPTVSSFSNWLSDIANLVYTIQDTDTRRRVVLHATENVSNERQHNGIRSTHTKCAICREEHKVQECKRFLQYGIDQRWDEVKAKRLCFSCMRSGHSVRECRNKTTCLIGGCQRKHNRLLHRPGNNVCVSSSIESRERQRAPPVEVRDQSQSVQQIGQRVMSCNTSSTSRRMLFRVLPIMLYGARKCVSTYAMLDEGSSVTMIDSSLIEELGIKGQQHELILQWYGGRTVQQAATIVNLEISGRGMRKRHNLRNVFAVSDLDLPEQSLKKEDLCGAAMYFHKLPKPFSNVKPKLLIGLDHCHLGLPTETMRCGRNGPYAANTELGWVIFGPSHKDIEVSARCLHMNKMQDENLHDLVNKYFEIENFGVRPAPAVKGNAEVRAENILKSTTKRINGRFQTGLLWSKEDITLPDSYQMAEKRLRGVEQKMVKNSTFAAAYKSMIESYIIKGYARKLETSEYNISSPRTWYLPHFAVQNPNKPEKLRLVFDAAATVNGVSLNSYLLKGPQDYQPMPTVLYNFRVGAIGVCGDIKEMFHQILIRPEDRCSQRFLWRSDASLPPDRYEMQVMTFGAACSPCAAQYVKTLNAMEYIEKFPRAVEAIVKHHYVDDFVDSFNSVQEAVTITEQVRKIHEAAGFQMREFVSNATEVMNLCGNTSEPKKAAVSHFNAQSATEKVLGMVWHPKDDTFRYELKFHRVNDEVVRGNRPPTKRELLSYVMSIFDPLGFLCHLTIGAKLLMREVWSRGIAWDEPLDADINTSWINWKEKVQKTTTVRIARHYFKGGPPNELQLHVFVDASEDAFSAVCYWRYIGMDGLINTTLIGAKSKCAPTKLMSIPRLELQAAVLGVRLSQLILEEHKLACRRFLWSDSTTVISWLKSEHRRYKPFVAHRIAEILHVTQPNDWNWVPTKENVADDATRRKHAIDFEDTSRWFKGPRFLSMGIENWPIAAPHTSVDITDEELPPKPALFIITINNINIQFNRFSSYSRLKRTIAWVLKFINRCRRLDSTKYNYGLCSSDINAAERLLCRLAQESELGIEVNTLRHGQSLSRGSAIYNLLPYIDDNGILRVGGRLQAASWLPLDCVHPIILPEKHRLTDLIVKYYHEQMKHQYIEATIGEIRQKYWILHIRRVLKRVIANCMICRTSRVKPVQPIMGTLPKDRLTPYVRPFSYTGLDYFGPLTVSIGRRVEKRWVALFTCLTVRAVHLELAADLSTDSCIIVIRNFINRRGVPVRIRSDNGKNFVGVDREAKRFDEVFDCELVQGELSKRGIDWVFNCPDNPSEGGIWERMVQCVKRVLRHTLKEVSPREHTLQSVLIEAENIINSRPLTHVPIAADQEEPLTPNHFLLGGANTVQTPSINESEERTCALRKQWRIARQLRDRFWKRWIMEYLPTLTRRAKWCEKAKKLEPGDVVFICDVNVSRRKWCRGVIERVYTGTDGEVRRADVRTSYGILRRPASKLAVLDLVSESG